MSRPEQALGVVSTQVNSSQHAPHRGGRGKDAILCHLLTVGKGPVLLEAGPGGPWFCGPAEVEGWPIGQIFSNERAGEPRGPGHGRDLPTQPPHPSLADAVPSHRLACETLTAP